MSNVISLAAVRQDRRQEEAEYLSYHEIAERILNLKAGYVSTGAVVLLHHVAYLIDKGHAHLSYTYLCERIGVSRPTLSAYIDELEDKELLRVSRARKDTKYNRPNFFEIDFTGPLGADVPVLKMPRNPNKKGSKEIELPAAEVVKKVNGYIDNKENKKLIPKGIGRSAPAFETIDEALTFSEKRITRSRTAKVAKAVRPGGQLTLAGVKATWSASMLKHYPSVPPVTFTQKEFAIFKAKVQPMLATCNLSELFDFIVSSWQTLRETKFIWLRVKGKDVALAPALPEMMRYWKIFAQAFADSRMVQANNETKGKRTAIEELEDKLATERAEKARLSAEKARLQERLTKAERMASAPIASAPAERSLSARQKALDGTYNEGYDLPDWR